jgi:predicted ester cyclase
MTIVELKDGKIVEAWNEFNFMEMYRQLGALNLNVQ